ncbi:MAG TPA: RIP metalloprotease RseP [Bacilli bacterium]|nr:RIP metalloprotease RseP [Bacilli bacterium]
MNIVMALLALGFLIFIHELGHYWAARATGVRVEEFAVGFGPPILKHKRNGILYRLNILPLGGYVRMLGEDNPEAATAPDNFNNRPIAARILVISAGVIMNLIGAFLILTLLFNVYGTPTSSLVVGDVVAGTPAQKAGFQSGDQLVEVNGIALTNNFETFNEQVQSHKDQALPVDVKRDGKVVELTVVPTANDKGETKIGISIGEQRDFVKQGGFLDNVGNAFTETKNLIVMIFDGFYKLVTGNVSFNDLGGPVEIIRITGQASDTGMPYFLYIVSLLSVNLAVLNILPFPALDGGRLVFLILEWIRRGKRIPVEKEASINFVGILFLLTLMVLVTFKDVFHIFTK